MRGVWKTQSRSTPRPFKKPLEERKSVRGFQIDDLAALNHGAGLCDRDGLRLDVLVVVRLVWRIGRGRAQIGHAEEDQLLVAEPRRRIPAAQPLDPRRGA